MTEFAVIAGLSGAGRSTVADALEDRGWFVIDNLPTPLIPKVAELAIVPESSIEQVALALGSSALPQDILPALADLRAGPARGAGALPRGLDRGAGPALREHQAPPPPQARASSWPRRSSRSGRCSSR